MFEGFIGARGKKIVQIATVIGTWGAISAILALMAGFGEGSLDDPFSSLAGHLTYLILLSGLLIFFVLGAYVGAGFGENSVEAIILGLGSSLWGAILAQISQLIIFKIGGEGNSFDFEMHLLTPVLVAGAVAILGSSLRIIQDFEIEGFEDNEQQRYIDENRSTQGDTTMQLHTISSSISRQHEARLNQIESILYGNRFTQLLYGKKMEDTVQSVDNFEVKPNPFAVLDGAEREI